MYKNIHKIVNLLSLGGLENYAANPKIASKPDSTPNGYIL